MELLTGGSEQLALLVSFIGICAVFASLVTEVLKGIKGISKAPTKLVCYIVSVCVTVPGYCAMAAYLSHPVEWYEVFASFLAAFVVAKVSMGGWDEVAGLWNRMKR